MHLFRERLLLRLFSPMLDQGRVLDAGCGSGSLALELCRRGYLVDAVDASPEFVQLVEGRAALLGLREPPAVRQASVTALPFADGRFDGLLCGEVLEHVRPEDGGDEAALREFRRVLRLGAPCAVSVPLNPGLWDHADEWAGHVKRYTRAELRSLFEDHGFTVTRTRCWGFPLGRIYHRLLFGPWLKRASARAVAEREARLDTRAGRSALLVRLAAAALRFDLLFGRWEWGSGVVLCARRRH